MLAIVIPYFKIAFFEETLISLSNQTCKNFHVYIGDDASPYNPCALIEKFEKDINITYKRFEDNLGGKSLATQWHRCIAMIGEEDWLILLGDDDCLGKTVVATWNEKLSYIKNKFSVVRFASYLINEKSQIVSDIYTHPELEIATDSYYRKFRSWTRSSLSEYIFSKDAYQKFKFYNYPLAWNSDDRAWLEFSDGKPIYTINNAFVLVRISDLNISGRRDNLKLKRQSQILFYKFLIEQKFPYYNNEQRLHFLRRCQKLIEKNGKPTLADYKFLFIYYIRYLNFSWTRKLFLKFKKLILE